MKTETLIVGQGLAGSVLANALQALHRDFLVLDNPLLSSSSKIAAGIWNPVVFKRMTLSWMAKQALTSMHNFYSNTEHNHQSHYFFSKKLLKFFTEEQEAVLWMKKNKTELKDLVEEKIYSPDEFNYHGLQKPKFGFSYVTESGFLDCSYFINTTRDQLIKSGQFVVSKKDKDGFQINSKGFILNDIECEKVIFCEGWLASNNSFFDFIPFKPAKGELLFFESEELQLDVILNKGIFILPVGGKLFVCGATYEWNTLNDRITEEKQSFLEVKLKELISCPYKVLNRKAGVRPSVIDRRPVIGEHPRYKNLYIFNGFGTKSVLLAPYFSKILLDSVFKNQKITDEVNVARFINHLA